jgi:lysophospholipase L1-like esterase
MNLEYVQSLVEDLKEFLEGSMKSVMALLGLLFVGVVSSIVAVGVSAIAVPSWTNIAPTVLHNTSVTSNVGSTCTGYNQSMVLAELHATYTVCAFGDDHLKIGYFSSGGPYRGAVEFPYSNEGHVLEGACEGVICRYSPDTDTLVTQRSVGQYTWGVVLFKNASARIHRIQSGGVTKYVFDNEYPDYGVKNDTGQYLGIPSFGLSENGKWLVVELRDAGLAIVDTNSFSERQIVMTGYKYGYGLDPTEQLAVSNDGKSVALMGMNAGFSVIDVIPGCGQALIGDLRQLPSTLRCPSSDFGIGTLFPNFRSAEQPRFFGNGQQLEVVVNSWIGGSRSVVFLQSGSAAVHKLKLLSLGDSFTSGEGESDTRYYQPGTDDSFDTCHVSSRAYPFLVARRIAVASNEVKSVACAGAKVKDIVGSEATYWGQAHRLGAGGLKLSTPNKITAQSKALESFQPGRVLQSSFLERYNPEAITIGVGGNDAGLMGKLKTCAMPGTCEWAQAQGLRATASEIRRLYGTLGSLFSYIAKHNPDAKVYAVGYPDIIEADGTCDAVTGLLLDHSERVFLDKSLEYLNQIIRAAVQHAGFTYLDIEHSLDGKKLCSRPASTAMNGLRLGSDISVIKMLPMLKMISAGTFHPTPTGHVLIADAILAGHPGLRQSAVCSSDPMPCSISELSIEPSPYWGAQTSTPIRLSYATDFALPVSADSRKLTIDILADTFEPGSSVDMIIQSEPISLGTLAVDGVGGVAGTATIPPNVENGFHTLHLQGINREGNLIDLYQFVTIGEIREVGTLVTVGADEDDSSVISTGDVQLSNIQPAATVQRLREAVDTTGVLGSQASSLDSLGLLPATPTQVRHIKEIVKTNMALVVTTISLGIIVLTTICAILLRRRWAKPSS